MPTLHVRAWSREEFFAGRERWQALLARSQADPLFMSWDWLSGWWRHHEAPLRAELCVLGVHSDDGELQGIAPFYRHTCRHRGLFRARRLELLGNAWRDDAAIYSEYLDLLADTGMRAAVCEALREWLRASGEWDELVLANLRPGSVAAQLARACAGFAYPRAVDATTGWSVTLPASFEEFAAGLSSNTRRKTLHQRTKLTDATCVTVGAGEYAASLARLEALVESRWGRAQAAQLRAQFHAEVAARLGDGVRLTELRSGTECVSVLLNVRAGKTEYYLLSGFDARFAQGVSPGYLHLGYAIEAACGMGVRHFDFLAGRGLHRDYKADFGAQATPLQSVHLVRMPSLRVLFRLADRLRGARQID